MSWVPGTIHSEGRRPYATIMIFFKKDHVGLREGPVAKEGE